MHVRALVWLALGTCILAYTRVASAEHVSLTSSPGAFKSARQVAQENNLDTYITPSDVTEAVARGDLVRLKSNGHFIFTGSFPYALPEVADQIEILSTSYFEGCGSKLAVTSVVRARIRQPTNAAKNSLHLSGMAIDLGIPKKADCLKVLENSLRLLERNKILFSWKETDPPHYHIAVNINTPKALLKLFPQEIDEEPTVEKASFIHFSLPDIPILEPVLILLMFWGSYRLVNPQT